MKAADEGVVAYAGNELKGYGNLVLIRHANGYVSAYANNSELLVKRGDSVKRGQDIARCRADRQRDLAAAALRNPQGLDPGRSDEVSRRLDQITTISRRRTERSVRRLRAKRRTDRCVHHRAYRGDLGLSRRDTWSDRPASSPCGFRSAAAATSRCRSARHCAITCPRLMLSPRLTRSSLVLA